MEMLDTCLRADINSISLLHLGFSENKNKSVDDEDLFFFPLPSEQTRPSSGPEISQISLEILLVLQPTLSVNGKESGTQLVCLVCEGPETGDSLSHFLSTIKTQY